MRRILGLSSPKKADEGTLAHCTVCGVAQRFADANSYICGNCDAAVAGQIRAGLNSSSLRVGCGNCKKALKIHVADGSTKAGFRCPHCSGINHFAIAPGQLQKKASAQGQPAATVKVKCANCTKVCQAVPSPVGGLQQITCPACGTPNQFRTDNLRTQKPPPPQQASDRNVIHVICGSCQSKCRVAVNGTGTCQFTCKCGKLNQFTVGGVRKDKIADIPVEYPEYWKANSSSDKFFENEEEEIKQAIQDLINQTWKDVRTRDAKINGRHGKMERFEVVMVQRNENPKLWDPYYRLRQHLTGQISEHGGCQRRAAKTSLEDDPRNLLLRRAKLWEDVNEFYLFHGTKPSAVKSICDAAFHLNMAGKNAGTLYGPGLYFAEASTKSDEYADDDKEGIFTGLYAMILCRVMCGRINYTDEVAPNVQTLVDSVLLQASHHSVLGDREKCRGTYREFIVFDKDQAYPEYVVIYRRKQQEDDPGQPLADEIVAPPASLAVPGDPSALPMGSLKSTKSMGPTASRTNVKTGRHTKKSSKRQNSALHMGATQSLSSAVSAGP